MDWNKVVSAVATEEGLLCVVRGVDGAVGSEPVLVAYGSGTCVQDAPFQRGGGLVAVGVGEEQEQQPSRHAALFYQLGLGGPPGELGAERPQVTYGHPTCPTGYHWDATQGKCVYALNPPILPSPGMPMGPGPTRHWKILSWNVSGVQQATQDVYMDQLQVQQHIRNVYQQFHAVFPSSMYHIKVQALPAPNTPIPTGGAYGFETIDGQHITVLQTPTHVERGTLTQAHL